MTDPNASPADQTSSSLGAIVHRLVSRISLVCAEVWHAALLREAFPLEHWPAFLQKQS